MIQRYPLSWPEGWKRTLSHQRRHATFNKKEAVPGATWQKTVNLSIEDAIRRVFDQLERLGVKHVQEDVVVSTNLRVNLRGIPRGWARLCLARDNAMRDLEAKSA